jgi:hypothetical protein
MYCEKIVEGTQHLLMRATYINHMRKRNMTEVHIMAKKHLNRRRHFLTEVSDYTCARVISGFRSGINEIFALLGCYAA